ncbi:MAG: hypothetical protein ACM3Q2_06050, partial [Syntrophothermus sp.]
IIRSIIFYRTMLNRIINIKNDVGLGSRPRAGNLRSAKTAYGHNGSAGNDSISFSPAVSFLARIGWHLKEINYSGKEKLQLTFEIGEFEFRAEIDFLKYNSEPRQMFEIIYSMAGSTNRQRLALTVTVKKEEIHPEKEIEQMELVTLKKLFGRIAFLEIKNELSRKDSRLISDLMDEINFQIVREFEYINRAFIALVDKLLPGSILRHRKFEEAGEPVIIEKIKVVSNDR